MLVPENVTVADYNAALATEEVTHARITFILDNIVFQDTEIEQGGIQLSTYMNPDDNMSFGTAYSTEATIRLLRSEKTDSVNFAHEFTVEFGVEIGGDIEWVTVGHFTGEKPIQTITSDIVELIAYDKMVRFDKRADDFISRLTFPCTLADIYDELCDFVVLDHVAGDEIASVMAEQYTSADSFDFASCREILSCIAEANGCYAKMTADGKVQLVWFGDHTADQSLLLANCFSGNIIKLEKSYSKKWAILDGKQWKDLESVKYSEYDDSENPFSYSYMRFLWTKDNEEKDIYQPAYDPYHNNRLWANVENYQWIFVENMQWKELETKDDLAGNTYTISDNPFLLHSTDADIKAHLQYILDNLELFNLHYVASVTMTGNWLIEPGDVVLLEIQSGTFIEYPIFNRTLKWNGICECYYETTGSLKQE